MSNRGFGTQGSVDPVILGAQKTRLNDPVLSFMGTNDSPGDYRNSGCASCHVIYANDRDPFNSGPYAKYGNRGLTVNDDPTIDKTQSGHPIRHEFTRKIPSSQCITCHVHNGNGFLNTYLGYMWWDQQTEGEHLYPKEQKNPTPEEFNKVARFNPEEAAARGLWNDVNFLDDPFISGRHAQITMNADGQVTLTDLGSKNGTFVRINDEAPLGHGDYVFLGQQLLRVEVT